MYPFFLVVCVALVILSPLALEFWLHFAEHRAHRRYEQATEAKDPAMGWASPRLH